MVCGGNNLSRGTSGSGNGVESGVGAVTSFGDLLETSGKVTEQTEEAVVIYHSMGTARQRQGLLYGFSP